MNLMFWKKKSANDTEAAPGLLARIKALLPGRIKSPPPFKAEVVEDAETLPVQAAPAGEGESLSLEYASGSRGKLAEIAGALISMARARMLIVGVALLLLLLLAFGYAAWTIFRSSPDQKADVTELIDAKRAPSLPIVMPVSVPEEAAVLAASAVSAASAPVGLNATSAVPIAESHTKPHMEQPASSVMAVLPASAVTPVAPVSHTPQTEIEALRQKNAELQKKFDALKKEQQTSSTSVRLYPGDRRGAPAGGVATVGNSDPKAAAMTLKEAIEAMNAGSNYKGKSAK